jgi:predicted component of type VI protein secretion system
MNLVKILTLGYLLLIIMAETSCGSMLATADKEAITNLAAETKEVLARDEKVKAKRKELEEEINKIIERERLAAAEVQRLNGVSSPGGDEKAHAAAHQWLEARVEMKATLKQLEPRLAEVSAEEKALSADKEKLQAAARLEFDRLAREKKINKP